MSAAPLLPADGPLRVVIDTDTYNEIDDQFALVHALLSPERLAVEAIYAAPFHNTRSSGPGDGMVQSYDEILRLLELLDMPSDGLVHRGSEAFLDAPDRPQENAAVHDLIARATASKGPLYVVALAALTNIASALLLEPKLAERIVVVWLGGHALHWPHTREFNLKGDPHAARVVLRAPLVLIPCLGVASHLFTTVPELERHVEPHGAVGSFLAGRFKDYRSDHLGWAKEIWDMAPVAYLLDARWVETTVAPTPTLTDALTWGPPQPGRTLRLARSLDRSAIFRDLFIKLAAR